MKVRSPGVHAPKRSRPASAGRLVFTLSLAVMLVACAPPAHPVISEVFYDAIGDDTGWEFVEFYNPNDTPRALAGVTLAVGDGSAPGRWTTRWTGGAGDSIAAHGRLVVGGTRVTPRPQAIAALELQNGPDAVRATWPDGAVEVVGYGTQEFAEYACGAAAVDVPSGQSLARVPDDADFGSNALDFRAATPSPGRPNQVGRDVAVVAGSLTLVPEQPTSGEGATLRGTVMNRGREPVAAGAARIVVTATMAESAGAALGEAIPSGDSLGFSLALGVLADGALRLVARVVLEGDEAPENDTDTLRVRIGPGPLEITEIQFHPADGEGEWVEVRNRAGAALDPRAFTLSDRGVQRGVPTGTDSVLAADSLGLLAQDRTALLARYTGLDGHRVWEVRPWSTLNNANDSTGAADAVVVRERGGPRSDRVDYSAAGIPTGTPIERHTNGTWTAAEDPGGTPLRPAREAPIAPGRFSIAPRRIDAGGTVRLGWSLPWPRGRVTLELFDLAGRRVTRMLQETTVPATGSRAWSVSGLDPGVYVAVLRARAESGSASLVESRVMRIAGGAR